MQENPYANAVASLDALVKLIPGAKSRKATVHAMALSAYFQEFATLLNKLRRYHLHETGEESPFVKAIDKLIPRVDPPGTPVDPQSDGRKGGE